MKIDEHRTRTDPADQAVARPRSADRLLRLLRNKDWTRTADLGRAVRAMDRPHFEKNVQLLEYLDFIERRPLANGHGTEMRLHTPRTRPDEP